MQWLCWFIFRLYYSAFHCRQSLGVVLGILLNGFLPSISPEKLERGRLCPSGAVWVPIKKKNHTHTPIQNISEEATSNNCDPAPQATTGPAPQATTRPAPQATTVVMHHRQQLWLCTTGNSCDHAPQATTLKSIYTISLGLQINSAFKKCLQPKGMSADWMLKSNDYLTLSLPSREVWQKAHQLTGC